jgi:histidine triad (HIT) family protein
VPLQQECVFCDPADGRVLARADNIMVCWCLGPIVEGHVVIVPRRHTSGMVDLHLRDTTMLDVVRHSVAELMIRRYGGYLMFEHGHHAHQSELLHAHAHLHAVPLQVSIARVLEQYARETLYGSYRDRPELKGEYFFYADVTGESMFLTIAEPPPQMFVRKLLAEALNVPPVQLDWRRSPHMDVVDRTIATFGPLLRSSLGGLHW